MSKMMIWVSVSGAILIGLSLLGYREFFGPPEVVWRSQIRNANHLISQIELFRNTHGRLPRLCRKCLEKPQNRTGPSTRSVAMRIIWFGLGLNLGTP